MKNYQKIEADLKNPPWQEIADFMDSELFRSKYAAGFEEPELQNALLMVQILKA